MIASDATRTQTGSRSGSLNLRGAETEGEVAWETPGVCGSAIEFYSQGGSVVRTPLIEESQHRDVREARVG